MRVTDASKYGNIARVLSKVQSQHAKAAREASSGLRVENPSDDPVAAAQAARLQATAQRVEGHRAAIRNTMGDVELAESTLASAADIFTRANELAMAAGNGSLNASDRASMAKQVEDLQQELTRLSNTKGSRGYLFGGSQTEAAPFAANGTFGGDSSEFQLDIGAGPTTAGASGALAFTAAGGRNVFADLESLRTALVANDAAAATATLDGLEASRKQITVERGHTGLTLEKLTTTDATLEDLANHTEDAKARAVAADPFDAYSRLATLGQTLERSIAVSQQLLQSGNFWRMS
jgi:flagellar hook-associated protein 3 FlgL